MTNPLDYLVRTVWGEARGEDPVGQKAVAAVALNRARLSGQPLEQVLMAPDQFEPWSNPNTRQQLLSLRPDDPSYRRIAANIASVLDGDDPTGGATHFYAPEAQRQLGRRPPSWDNGSGFDIGRHRFFKLGYNGKGSQVQAPRAPVGADIFGLDDAPQATAPRESASAVGSGADIFGLGDDGEALPQTAAAAAAAPANGTGAFIDGLTGEALNEAQTATYADLNKRGALNPNAQPGSHAFPLAQRSPDMLPEPGQWYVGVDGKLQKVPTAREEHAGDSWLNTGIDLTMSALPFTGTIWNNLVPTERKDARAEALRQGGLSGLAMGGKNEILSAAASTDDFLAGGVPEFVRAFQRELASRDATDAQSREAFPVMWNTGAVAGSLPLSLAAPPFRGATLAAQGGRLGFNTAVGGASGYLSTDGTQEDRQKGALIGAGLGAALGPLANLVKSPTPLTAAAGAQADEALRSLGTSVEQLTPQARDALTNLIQGGRSPADAARIVMSQDLPVPIPLTRGQVTGLPTDQLNFNLALRGAAGDKSAEAAQAFVQTQQDAMRANVDNIAGMMADGAAPQWNQGGEAVSTSLNALREQAKKGVDFAYDTARAADAPAILPRYDTEALAGRMFASVEEYDALRIPAVARELDRVAALGRGDADLRQLFDARSRLTALRTSSDPIEAGAASRAVKSFDDFVGDAISAELFHGDPQTVDLWRSAIGKRREFGEIFEAGDLVERLTERTGYGGARRLKVDPGEAGNLIFGRSAMGSVGRANLYTDLSKVRQLLGANSEEWKGLRAEHFVRLASSGEGGVENGAQQFSGAKFLKAWNDAKAKDMRLIETLYTPEEVATINRFAATTARITNPVKGGDNSSNTAVALKALGKIGGMIGAGAKATPLVRDIAQGLEEIAARGRARASMQPTPRNVADPMTTQAPGRIGGYLGSLISSE